MDALTIVRRAKEVCTSSDGGFNKDKFRVIVAAMYMSLPDECQENQEAIDEYNRAICQVLGRGHSLVSCLQFWGGRKAKPYVDSIEAHLIELN